MSEGIPDGWAERCLGEVVEARTSNVDKKTVKGEIAVRLCNYMDVYANDYVRADLPFMEATATRPEIDRFGLEVGDVIITKDSETPDDIGIPTVVEETLENLVCGYHLALIKPDRAAVEPLYLSKFLSTDRVSSHFLARANGSTRYGLTQDSIHSVPLLVPPLPTQRRIAEVLRTVDEVIEWTEKRIEKQQAIKQGLLHDLFTRGLTPDGELRPSPTDRPDLYQDSPLGPIPKEWEVSSAAAEFSIASGITLGPHRRPDKAPHPYLRVANVYRDRLELEDIAMLEAFLGEPESLGLQVGDLLVVEGHANPNEIGRVAMADERVLGLLFQNHLFRLRANRIEPRFGLLWLNSFHAQSYWRRTCATSSGLNTINRRMLGAMPIAIPTDGEQARIVDASFSSRDSINGEINHLTKLRHLKSALMQDLLTGRVSADGIDLEALSA